MEYCIHCMAPIEPSDEECPFCGKAQKIEVPGHHLLPGTVLNHKFLVGTALGEGGFGITYIGRDLNLDMKVAVKEYYPVGYVNRSNTISAEVQSSTTGGRKEFFEKGRENFLKEARILAKFSSEPGIVEVRDFFEENHTAYIVMEFLDGQDLKDYIQQKGFLPPEETVQMLLPVMQSLKKIHAQGLIHRDISPDNIRITENGVKLMDFGAARTVSAAANKSLSVMLKPGYAPEEQYRSKGVQGPWTDVYALCATMYKCITGITPDDSTQRMYSDELKTPSVLGVRINEVWENALMKGLAVLQKDRYQSIDELINGFKGIEAPVSGEEKTVYSGRVVSQDEIATKYMEDPSSHVVTQKTPLPEEQEESQRVQLPIKKEQSPLPPNPQKEQDEQKKLPVPPIQQEDPPTPKAKKKWPLFTAAAVVAVLAISILWAVILPLFNTVTIAGNEVDKNKNVLQLFNKTIDIDDMQALLSMENLERLTFESCTFEADAAEKVGQIKSNLEFLSFQSCEGIEDFSQISQLANLKNLTIIDSGLTDEKLAEIDFSKNNALISVDFSNNPQLSDLSNLQELSDTLEKLCVSKTSVIDFSPIQNWENLTTIEAEENGLKTLSTLTNSNIQQLFVKGNQITDISGLRDLNDLEVLDASQNQISDLSALEGHKELYNLKLNQNHIANIDAISGCEKLMVLDLSDNEIQSLAALSSCGKLEYVYVNRNQLKNLSGLEQALELSTIEATENQLENIDGLSNSTVLKEVNLNQNQISDISLLSKSAATLTHLYFNGNQVSDLSALKDTTALEYISFDDNQVTSLEPLSGNTSLQGISAERNQIESITGLSSSTKLKYVYLSHNQIESVWFSSPLSDNRESQIEVLDVSSNQISSIEMNLSKEIRSLAVYNNPIQSLQKIADMKGQELYFSPVNGTDYSVFEDDTFSKFKAIDCPLDQQVSIKDAIQGGKEYFPSKVDYITLEEADQLISETKPEMLVGSTALEETETE